MLRSQILLIEDDRVLNEQLNTCLSERGYRVHSSYDGEEGLCQAASGSYDLILLDIMLPKRDGYSVLLSLRKSCQAPVLILSAKGAEEERIKGFTEGADDYLAKPFNQLELLLRIEALLKRCQPQLAPSTASAVVELAGLKLDRLAKTALVFAKHSLDLTPLQFKLLWELLLHQNEVLSKAYLYQVVLKRKYSQYDRSLDMHISRIRRKLLSAGWQGDRLATIHGKGYVLS